MRETLTFSAALRLPKTVDNKTVRQIVDQTIDELGLKECADTVVGGIFRKGISGGERRYVLLLEWSNMVLSQLTALDVSLSAVFWSLCPLF